jgi:hypothetical protein
VGLEERLYRHRCVEAWSMAVPWTGFPLSKLVALAKPASGAKYIRFETFMDKAMAPGQRAFFYPWPYTEGLTLAEAGNDLAFVVTGVYGKPLPNQFGARPTEDLLGRFASIRVRLLGQREPGRAPSPLEPSDRASARDRSARADADL